MEEIKVIKIDSQQVGERLRNYLGGCPFSNFCPYGTRGEVRPWVYAYGGSLSEVSYTGYCENDPNADKCSYLDSLMKHKIGTAVLKQREVKIEALEENVSSLMEILKLNK